MTVVAAPCLFGASVGLLFPRAWQRVVFSGAAPSAIYAAVLSALQADMLRRGPPSPGSALAEPAHVAAEAAFVAAPVGMCAGLMLHLITRYIRKNTA